MADFKSITLNGQLIMAKDEKARGDIQSAQSAIDANALSVSIINNNLRALAQDVNKAAAAADSAAITSGENAQQIATLQNEIVELIASTTPPENSELINIRVGADGITYPLAGDAVRGQYSRLADRLRLKNMSMAEEINTSALWESGAILNTTGENIDNPERIRTKYFLDTNICWLDLNTDTRGALIYGYDAAGNYAGEWSTDGTWVQEGNGFQSVSLADIYDKYPNYKLRLSIYTRNGTYPTVYESSSYKMYNAFSNYGQPQIIKILQYNIGKFNMGRSGGLSTNVVEKINNYKEFFGNEKFDFACFQEYTEYIDDQNQYRSDETLMNYPYQYSSHFEREKIIKSNYKLYNSFFSYLHVTEQPPSDMIRCDTRVNNKPLAIVTGVLNVEAPISQKVGSIQKFIQLNMSRPNVIACFDTNALSESEAVTIRNAFAEGGYISANWDYFGFLDTYNLASTMYHSIDNVFVKGAAKIVNVNVPDVYADLSSDHFPFITEVAIL